MSRLALLLSLVLAGCAAGKLPDLAQERAQLRGARSPKALRDYGWAELALGNHGAGEAALQRALAAGLRDARVRLGLALQAHEIGDTATARAHWLALLEEYDPQDPWAPAAAEAAAQRLLALVNEPPGTAEEERRFMARAAALWRRPLGLPPEARQLLAALLAQLLRLAGREADARAIDEARGCPRVLYSTGPYGHLPRLDLLRAFGPDDPTSDPGRPRYQRREPRGCELPLEAPPGRPGVVYAVAWARGSGGPLPLSVEAGGETWALYVDGHLRHRELEPQRRRLLWVDLPAGWHALSFKVSVSGARVQLQVSLPGATFYGGPPRAAPLVAGADVPVRPRPLSPLPEPRRRAEVALRGLLRAQQAHVLGAVDEGLDAVATAGAPRLAALRLLEAALVSEDESRPQRLVRDRVRRVLGEVLAADPRLLRARINLAHMELQDDRPEQALQILDERPPAQRRRWTALLLRHRILRARQWLYEAEQALEEARAAGPAACGPLEALVELRRALKDDRGALAAARALAECNPYSERYAEDLRSAGDLDGARREYERLLRLQPESEGWLAALGELQLALGDAAGARRTFSVLTRRYPRTATYWTKVANALIDLGDRAGATEALRMGLRDAPESVELHRALQALGQAPPMQPDRVDGLQVIREYAQRKVAAGPRDAAVIVLDRTVVRVFPGGARWTLTHNIMQVLSKDGIDKFGEVQIPEGAEVLTLRTVKADGSTREPEEIAEKEAVSAPDLEEGDFVEFEYIDRDDPPGAFPGGFIADRFYFATAEAALDRTEFVLVTPWEMPLQLDVRGPAPPAARVERRGGLRVTTWARRGVPRLLPEPPQADALLAEWVPSVRAASGVTLERWRDFLRDRWFLALRPNAELRRTAAQVAGGRERDLLERVRRLDAWVRRNVKPGSETDEPATMALARREGSLHLLLAALLREAGIDVELWLVRPQTAPRLDGPLPPVDLYTEQLLAVGDGSGPPRLWLNPAFRHAPTGFVRPLLRGGQALRLGQLGPAPPPAQLFATVALDPDGRASGGQPTVRDERRVEMRLTLLPDGSGEVHVRERLSGWPALEWREELERVPADKVREELEQRSLGFFFPGASLEDLRYGSLDDDGAPLQVEYTFCAPQLARRRAGLGGRAELVLPAPFPALLGRRYVGVPQRRSPLQLSYVVPMVLEAQVQLPEGAGTAQAGPQVALSAFGRFAQQVEVRGRQLRLRAEFSMPAQRVEPGQYADFVRHARRVDAAEDSAAVIPLGEGEGPGQRCGPAPAASAP